MRYFSVGRRRGEGRGLEERERSEAAILYVISEGRQKKRRWLKKNTHQQVNGAKTRTPTNTPSCQRQPILKA